MVDSHIYVVSLEERTAEEEIDAFIALVIGGRNMHPPEPVGTPPDKELWSAGPWISNKTNRAATPEGGRKLTRRRGGESKIPLGRGVQGFVRFS